jgi:type II secretory pathway pseudopilin PulG
MNLRADIFVMRNKRELEAGITLVELLVTIVILLSITGIAVPIFLSQGARSNQAATIAGLGNAAGFVSQGISDGSLQAIPPTGQSFGNIGSKFTSSTGSLVADGLDVVSSAFDLAKGTFCVSKTDGQNRYVASNVNIIPHIGSCSTERAAPAAPFNAAVSKAAYASVVTLLGSGTTNVCNPGNGISTDLGSLIGALVMGPDGNLYASDLNCRVIWQITPTGDKTVYAGIPEHGSNPPYTHFTIGKKTATYIAPWGLAFDPAGNLYFSDIGSYQIGKIDIAGNLTFVAGGTPGYADGSGFSAGFGTYVGLCSDSGGTIFGVDTLNNRIRKITPAGVVTTLSGNGSAGYVDGVSGVAQFNSIQQCIVDGTNHIYVTDAGNNAIRKVTTIGYVSTVAGGLGVGELDGTTSVAKFSNPSGIYMDTDTSIYISDNTGFNGSVYNVPGNVIRKIGVSGNVTTVAGTPTTGAYLDASTDSAEFNYPSSIAMDLFGAIYIADVGNGRIRVAL